MLRKVKTKLTREDLNKPAIKIEDAVMADGSTTTTAGAFLLPEDNKIHEALSAPAVPKTTDWMLKGDPTAPALKDLEARALEERQKAMVAAAQPAQSPFPAFPGAETAGTVTVPDAATAMPVNVSTEDQVPVPTDSNAPYQAPTTSRFPWAANPQPAQAPVAKDDIDQFAEDMGVAPIGNGGTPDSPALNPIQAVNTYAPPTPTSRFNSPTEPPLVSTAADEVVIHIAHNTPALEVSGSDSSQQSTPADVIIGSVEPTDAFAAGAAVKIQHESPLSSLPYSHQSSIDSVAEGPI